MVKNPPINAGDISDMGLIPESGRSPGGGHGNPLQYSYLENPRDRGAWWATVHGVTKSWTQVKQLSKQAYMYVYLIHFAVHLKQTQHCKSTKFQWKNYLKTMVTPSDPPRTLWQEDASSGYMFYWCHWAGTWAVEKDHPAWHPSGLFWTDLSALGQLRHSFVCSSKTPVIYPGVLL